MSTPHRREFLTGVATLGALASLTTACSIGPGRDEGRSDGGKRPPAFRISLAEWSYHRALQKGALDHRDFARVAKLDHGIDVVEFVNSFFKDKARDAAYLAEVKSRAADLGVRIALIMCDGEGDLGHAEKSQRAAAVENHRKWLEAAHGFGCHSIRVNVYGSGSREAHAAQAAESLHALADLADPLGLNVIVENHGGITSDGAWMADVMRRADHPRVGTLPDFGNFKLDATHEYDRYRGVEEMMPWAKAVSAKCYDFDASGEETTIDFHRMLRIVTAARYHDNLGIEYEGDRMTEHDGVAAMKRLLERVRSELA